MSNRNERLAQYIREVTSTMILERVSDYEEEFGIIGVVNVVITPDRSYADVYVSSERNQKTLPKALALIAGAIRSRVGRDVSIWKAPSVRFRIQQEAEESSATRVTNLIASLSSQYDLHSED